MSEQRVIPRHDGYLVCDEGHVYTTFNTRRNPIPVPKRLAERDSRYGYPVVQLRIDGKNKNKAVHALIALAFHGERNGLEVNHVDGDKHNNKPGNLEYVSRSQNMLHAFRTGLKIPARGEKIARATLRADQINDIRNKVAELRSNGRAPNKSMGALAKEFDVTPSALDHIARRRSWKHIP